MYFISPNGSTTFLGSFMPMSSKRSSTSCELGFYDGVWLDEVNQILSLVLGYGPSIQIVKVDMKSVKVLNSTYYHVEKSY